MAFCFRLSHALFELQTRKKLEKLTENAAESIHGRILLVGVFAFTNLMRWIRPSFQIPNLDKSDVGYVRAIVQEQGSVRVTQNMSRERLADSGLVFQFLK